jgi:hypothetical protein
VSDIGFKILQGMPGMAHIQGGDIFCRQKSVCLHWFAYICGNGICFDFVLINI